MIKKFFEKYKDVYLNRKQRALIMWATLIIIGVALIPLARYVKAQEYYPINKYKGVIPGLCYHCIDEPSGPVEYQYEYIEPEEFEKQIKWLVSNDYVFITADEYSQKQEMVDNGDKTKYVMLSFDDGYESTYAVTEILKKYDIKASIFVIASRIGTENYLSKEELKSMADSGYWTIGSHGYSHRILPNLDSETLSYELTASKDILESITGKKVSNFAYPEGITDYITYCKVKQYYENVFLATPEGIYGIHRQGIFSYTTYTQFKAIMNQYY